MWAVLKNQIVWLSWALEPSRRTGEMTLLINQNLQSVDAKKATLNIELLNSKISLYLVIKETKRMDGRAETKAVAYQAHL